MKGNFDQSPKGVMPENLPKTTFKNCVKFAEFSIRKIGLRPQAHFRQSQKLFGRDRQIFVVVAVVAFKGDDEDTVK